MNILGINAYHGDSAACLVIDGKVVNAIEEERIRRVKHWAGFPIEAIKWCLKDANVSIKNVDYIALARKPSSHLHKRILMALTKRSMSNFVRDRLSHVLKMADIKAELAKHFDITVSEIKAKVEKIEHHKAHIASAFLVSPYDNAACVSIDGFGDFLSTMRAIGEGNKIKIIDWVEYPHSLGIFYTAFTQFLGFWNYGDEYKVMGLSSYGEPVYLDLMHKIVKLKSNGLFELDTSFFTHAEKGVEMVWENGIPTIGRLFSDKLIDYFGNPREKDQDIKKIHENIAASVQLTYEETFFHILCDVYKKTNLDSIVLSGGCIQNSLANGKILAKTPFKNIYIPPAAYDASLAIGASMLLWYERSGHKRDFVMNNPYLGPKFEDREVKIVFDLYKNKLNEGLYNVEYLTDEKSLCKRVAELIAKGKIVGWFQGRTEWGPRALGNRSIVVDPRKKEMKDVLNSRVKRRESFRPFAPSVLEEKVSLWFEQDTPSPFMEKTYKIKKSKQSLVPSVCHVDGSGRLQTVSKSLNEKYYNLIKAFEIITKVPMVLNTSFNENEPIVNTPQDALDCFFRTKMDYLAIGNFLIGRSR